MIRMRHEKFWVLNKTFSAERMYDCYFLIWGGRKVSLLL